MEFIRFKTFKSLKNKEIVLKNSQCGSPTPGRQISEFSASLVYRAGLRTRIARAVLGRGGENEYANWSRILTASYLARARGFLWWIKNNSRIGRKTSVQNPGEAEDFTKEYTAILVCTNDSCKTHLHKSTAGWHCGLPHPLPSIPKSAYTPVLHLLSHTLQCDAKQFFCSLNTAAS